MEKKFSLTVFLFKEYVENFDWCIKKEKDCRVISVNEELGTEGIIVVSETESKKPAWLELLNLYSNETIELKDNTSNKAALLLKVEDRIMAITFGYGRSFLVEEYIEKNFGFLSAINMIDTKRIRSINAATIEDMVVHTQKQSSYATGQEEFDLNVINDIMIAITGKAKNTNFADRVSGKDSLLVSVDMNHNEIVEKLQYYLHAYKSDKYKEAFAWIDNIREIRDKQIISKLESELQTKIKNNKLNKIYLTPPDTVDWEHVNGFMITGMNLRQSKKNNYSDEIPFEEYLYQIDDEIDLLSKMKRDKLLALNLHDESYTICSVFAALVAQVEFNNKTYILSDSNWYCIDDHFYDYVRKFISQIPVSDIELPDCESDEVEGIYNERVAEYEHFCLLDKRLMKVDGGVRQIEACDIYTDKNQFVHIKNKHNSAQLSHLFSQGRVSAECFISDQEFRKQVHDEVKKKFGNNIFSYRKKPGVGEYEVIYAIISKDIGSLEKTIPFFSMVNLMLAVQDLDRMHLKYSVKLIKRL